MSCMWTIIHKLQYMDPKNMEYFDSDINRRETLQIEISFRHK